MLFWQKDAGSQNDVTLGVSIGGTQTVFGYVDRKGRLLANAAIPTIPHQAADLFFERLHQGAKTLLESFHEKCKIVGVGVNAPNANYHTGMIESPPNLSWEYVDVLAEIGKYYHVPVATTNEANAIALGEMLFGAAQGMKNFIVITLGTGLGSGIVANGELICGADGNAGEIGHTTVDVNGRECGCGRRGCLETYVSATGICRTVHDLICNSNDLSDLRNIRYENLTFKMIYDAAQRGDRLALQAFDETGKILGMKLADSVAHLSPEAVIFFGGLVTAGDLLFNPAKQSMEEHLFGPFKNKVKLLPSGLEELHASILGASALIWNDLKTHTGISFRKVYQ
ncbi:MAG: ROK family protein [Ignavibacteriae bacterium]|nr:MAG: ROK family protein [Ignavibacteriota bacterium]